MFALTDADLALRILGCADGPASFDAEATLSLGGAPSPFVEPCAAELRVAGYDVALERVPYEFQKGGNRMMHIRRVN